LKSQYLYLLIVFFCLLFPLIASFYAKAPFYKTWKQALVAILLPALLFIIWDEIFTRSGIWGFNPKYVFGFTLASLPFEEILFFICVPYACLFTYFAVRFYFHNDYFFTHHELLSYAIIIGVLIAGIYNMHRPYTAVTFIGLSFFLAFLTLKVRARYLGHFYATFGLILIPFFIVNSVLTGSFIEEEVVWYNDAANLGIRLGTIPLEDIFYAMLLLLMNVSVYEWRQSRG
jgi:lycopene cyclase domain-containing protein